MYDIDFIIAIMRVLSTQDSGLWQIYLFSLQCTIQQSIWFDGTTWCNVYRYLYGYSLPIHVYNQIASMALVDAHLHVTLIIDP